MTKRRFMINSRSIRDGYASYDGDLFNHIVRVLRLGPGDEVVLADEQGREHHGVIDQVAKEWVAVKIVAQAAAAQPASNAPRITLCQALPKGEKIDLILQKGTELGVHNFWLFGGRRSIVRLRDNQVDAKLSRWNRIVSEAARQCGRATVPAVSWLSSVVEVTEASDHDLRLVLWEGEQQKSLREVVNEQAGCGSIIVAVGPEGGFDPLEIRHFSRSGFETLTIGRRILRTETAAIAILAILQYIYEDM